MAQNITLLGANYSAVPAVTLPKTGGGTAQFTDVTDTTAAAEDVAQGKYFYTANGTRTEGTGTGGGGGSVTQDQDGYIVLPPDGGSGGGGNPNTITGTFTTGAEGGIETVSLPYSGNGYPLSINIYPNEGTYNSNGTAYNTIKQYAVISFMAAKNILNTPPVYGTNNPADAFSSYARYKNSNQYATNATTTTTIPNYFLVDTDPITNAGGCVKINSSNQLKYVVIGASGYGLLPNTIYNYCIEFSE